MRPPAAGRHATHPHPPGPAHGHATPRALAGKPAQAGEGHAARHPLARPAAALHVFARAGRGTATSRAPTGVHLADQDTAGSGLEPDLHRDQVGGTGRRPGSQHHPRGHGGGRSGDLDGTHPDSTPPGPGAVGPRAAPRRRGAPAPPRPARPPPPRPGGRLGPPPAPSSPAPPGDARPGDRRQPAGRSAAARPAPPARPPHPPAGPRTPRVPASR